MDDPLQVSHGLSSACAGAGVGITTPGLSLAWARGPKAGVSSGSSAQGSCSPELGPCEDGCGLLCGRAGPERLTRACDFFPFEFIRGSARMVSRYRVSTAFILPSSQLIVERTLTLQGASPRLCVSLHLGPLLATGAGSAQAPRGREVTSRGQCVT